MTEQLSKAERLAAYGFSIIPLDHPDDPIANDAERIGKVPAVKWLHWQQAKPTRDNLQTWFGNGKHRNIGIVTGAISNIVVVDTDTPAAEAWASKHLPRTSFVVQTAKGCHRYYRHPGVAIPNQARIRKGVDVRADGGYVVAPGSLHASGIVYRELDPWPSTLDGAPVFDPQWLGMENRGKVEDATNRSVRPPIATGTDRDRIIRRMRAYLGRTPRAIEGQGGDTDTYRVVCCIVRGFNPDPSDARIVLSEWNNAKCVPPWTARELDAKIEHALKYGHEPFGARAADRPFVTGSGVAQTGTTHVSTGEFPLTDTGNAEAFAAWYGERLRFDHRRRRFLIWSGHRWTADADAEVERLAKETIRRRHDHAFAETDPDKRRAELKWALTSESQQRRAAMVQLAKSERIIADPGDAWDRDPWLLGVANGVVDLRTGELRDGRPEERMTMATTQPYDPSAACPLWESVVADIFGGDTVLIDYIHRAIGYSLTGITTEQCLWVPYGVGSNGKGTLLNTILWCLGDYGYQMPFSTVLGPRKDTATNDLAALEGRRFVLASEVNDGVRFDEARIKALTGCDRITARFLYGEYFEFTPVAKFWLAVNHRPVVRDDSYAFWRRILLVPFLRTFAVNQLLADQLRTEAPGILAWAVRGALLWQSEGLGAPAAVTDATTTYQRDSDVLGDFFADACVTEDDAEVAATELYRAYVAMERTAGARRAGAADEDDVRTEGQRAVPKRAYESRRGVFRRGGEHEVTGFSSAVTGFCLLSKTSHRARSGEVSENRTKPITPITALVAIGAAGMEA